MECTSTVLSENMTMGINQIFRYGFKISGKNKIIITIGNSGVVDSDGVDEYLPEDW